MYKKINILCWCKHCHQGSVRIIKNKYTNELYCECDEDYAMWASPDDYINGNCISENRLYYKSLNEFPFVLASEEEIISKGWNKPINKVDLCRQCFFMCDPLLGWVTIKKNKDTGDLFCKCELCGSVWKDITDVLKGVVPPINNKIKNYEDAAREEIIAFGWDKKE